MHGTHTLTTKIYLSISIVEEKINLGEHHVGAKIIQSVEKLIDIDCMKS